MKEKIKGWFTIETILVLVIACCLLFLNYFMITKINELQNASRDSIFISDELSGENDQELAEELRTYLPTSYKMIELYDENFDLLFQIRFDDQNPDETVPEPPRKNGIDKDSEAARIISSNEEGQSVIQMGNSEQDVYYKWIVNNKNEERLIIVYSKVVEVKNLWTFSFVCYIILILIFILLIRLHSNNFKDKVSQYRQSTDNVRFVVNK